MKRLCVLALLAAACAKEGPNEVSPVKSVSVSLQSSQIVVGTSTQARAVLLDADGNTILDRVPTWVSVTPSVVSVTTAGVVTGLQAGSGTVRAISGGAQGDATLVVTNPSAGSITLSRDAATIFIPNGSVQLIPTVKDANGTIIPNPTIFWQSTQPLIATVNAQGLVTGVAVGTTIIKASVDGQLAQAIVTVQATPNANAPLVVSINPSPLRPGGTYTVVGNNFAATGPGNSIVVDGVPVTVNSGNANALSITLPTTGFSCDPTRNVFLQVTAGGLIGGASEPLQVANVRTLSPGQSVVVSNPSEVRCNELTQTGGRYVFSVYNAFRSAVQSGVTGAVSVSVRGAAGAARAAAQHAAATASAPPVMRSWDGTVPRFGSVVFDIAEAVRRGRERDETHGRILDRNLEYLRANASAIRTSRSAHPRPSFAIGAQIATLGAITQLKVPNLDAANYCSVSLPVGVRTVFVGAHSVIVEDTLSAFNGKPTLQGQMNSYFTRLGTEFESVMWPILTANYGNPLVMDAQLSNTGKVVMLFSPRVNGLQGGHVLGFVATCDFQAVTQAPSSNVGEYFYAAVPTSAAAGYADGDTRDSWLRLMRATVIHEVKHVVQFGERLSRNLPVEDRSWEEGMARTVEELYARTIYGTQARQNTDYAASLFCDLRYTTQGPCLDRPLLMLRHFDALYQFAGSPEAFTPLGQLFGADATYYASAWSFLRWATDHFGASESQFFRDFTLNPATGVPNLEARTGHPWEEMMGEWSLALYLDDEPGFTPTNPRLRMPSWNIRNIFFGMCSDLGPCTNPGNISQLYPRANPFQPRALSYGPFQLTGQITGGGFALFELTGEQVGNQVLELRSLPGGDPAATIRIAIVRVQ